MKSLHTPGQWGTKENRICVIQMAWPTVLESFLISLAGMVDSLMVSRLGADAVAAVGLTTQPKFIGLAAFNALNVAVSALTARRKGSDDRSSANQVLMVALVASGLAGILISFICVTFSDIFISLCGSGPDTHMAAVEYFQIIMGCMIFTVISLTINASQRGVGDTRIAMQTNIVSNLINVIFNFLLIEGRLGFPTMGIQGAALATVLGSVIACIMSICSLFRKEGFISFFYIHLNKIKPTLEAAKSIVKIWSSALAEQLLMRVGLLSVAVMAAGLGTTAFAAHQVGMNVLNLSFSLGDGMQVAAVTLIGQSLGAGKSEQAKLYGAICNNMGKVVSIMLTIIFLFGGEFLYGLFFESSEIIFIGVKIMRVMAIIVLLQITQTIYTGCLRGAGDIVFTTIASMIGVTFIRPVSSYLFCHLLSGGIVGIWLGVATDQLIRYILTSWRFHSGKWTKFII